MQQALPDFLNRYEMHYSSIDIENCLGDFIGEMEAGLQGRPSTLMMLPTYLSTDNRPPANTPIVVMDAGGTNLRVATVSFNSHMEPSIDNFSKMPMPGTQGTLSRDAFFGALAEALLPVIHISQKVGFCFSFPTEILPSRDGRFLCFTKELSVTGMEGEDIIIGDELNKALAGLGVAEEKEFLLLNDTVAAMLGGTTLDPQREADSYIGFILGTGINTCYVEQCANITKSYQAVALPGSMIINMESGGYGGFPRGSFHRIVDEATNNPGVSMYEKMVSGAYQGQVVYYTVMQAAKDGIFSTDFSKCVENLSEITMEQMSNFCDNLQDGGVLSVLCGENQDDAQILRGIIHASYQRAAHMVCVNLGAIMKKTGAGRDPMHPVIIAVEGTTLNKSPTFFSLLNSSVEGFIKGKLGIHCRFVHAEDATLLGTAIAALTN